MSSDNDVFTGEYFVSLKGFKIPHKTVDKMAPFDTNNPPPPGTAEAEAEVMTRINDINESPLATAARLDKRPAPPVFDVPVINTVLPANPANTSPKPTKRSAMFMMQIKDGLPEDLVKLFKPLCCDLCGTKLNSPSTARLHYESKNHEKKINNWLSTWAEKTGEPLPKRPSLKKGPTGPNALHCDVCDLALTSLQHAKQHNLGKKHISALAGRTKPGGPGYYDTNNKWVRTAKIGGEEDPTNRFKIGEAFLVKNQNNTETVIVPESVLETPPPPPPPTTPPSEVSFSPRQETIPEKSKSKKATSASDSPGKSSSTNDTAPIDPAKYCSICKISVTSDMNMRLHLAGVKHAKKLRQLGEPPYAEEPHTLSQCILDESMMMRSIVKGNVILTANVMDGGGSGGGGAVADYSTYRTPSGQYYCQYCDLTVTSEATLSQHFASKRHLKTIKKK